MSLVLLSNPPLHLQLDTPSLGRGLGAETEYDLIMTKWETEGVGRGQEESVVVLRHKQSVVRLPRLKEPDALGAAPVLAPC